MTDAAFRFARTAALTAALALVTALGSAPASAGDHKLVVSAVILARDTCRIGSDQAWLAFTADASSPALATASMNTSLQCSGTARATTVRVRSDGGLNGGGVTGPRLRGVASQARDLPYRLEVPGTASVARGVVRTLKVGAVTTAGALREGASGGYEDTVVLTIEP